MNSDLIQLLSTVITGAMIRSIQQLQTRINAKDNAALKYKLDQHIFVFAQAKITPTKVGQFACIYKRNAANITQSYSESDNFDFMVIAVEQDQEKGVFIFPKSALIQLKIISSEQQKGKNGIRVYPPWDTPLNKQGLQTQKLHSPYFYSY